MRPLLELNNISYSYHTIDGETKALSDISFQLAPGEFAAVVGPSGCGKSTLLSLIAGLIEAENGYKRSVELSEEYGLYRQDYCGCEFSMREREHREKQFL